MTRTLPCFTLSPERQTLFALMLREAGIATVPEAIPRRSREAPLPLSFAQQRLWFLDRLEPGAPVYVIPIALSLEGPLDAAALRAALQALINRHESLRTIFPQEEGHPRQRISADATLPLPLLNLDSLNCEAQETELRRLAREEAQRPMELATGPLVRALLVRRATDSHVLFLTLHHIIADGWSLGILMRELSALYAERRQGGRPALSPLPIRYGDFAAWQRERLQGSTLEGELAYWERQLAGTPTLLELPSDQPRPAERTYWGDRLSRPLPRALVAKVRALAQQEGVTPFTLLLAVFALLLQRYTGQECLLIGTPVANRTRRELEDLIGFFVNTLVLRADVRHSDDFRTLLHRLAETVIEAQAHQEVPFELLVDALQPERNLGTTPLFQVMFDMQPRPAPLTAADLTLRWLDPPRGIAKFDLTFKVIEEPEGGLTTAVEYNTALFTAARMERMLAHFEVLLTGALATPEAPVIRLPLLTPAERQQLVSVAASAARPAPAPTLAEAVAAQAAATPDAPAAISDEGRLTYAALEGRARALAQRLRALGVGPEQRVGVMARRTPELLVALLGVLKSGAAYVPLEATDPPARWRYLIEDAGLVALVVTHTDLVGDHLPAALPCVSLEEGGSEAPGHSLPRVSPDGAAYVIYTSGSTGAPKGVVVSHRSVLNYLTWVNVALLPDPAERMPLVTRLTFDASLKQLWAPLLRGTPVWLLSEEVLADPARLMTALATQPATTFNGVPSLWQAMLDAVAQGRAEAPAAHLRRVLLGGEALSSDLVARTHRWFPQAALWNLYGPTELTANATAALITDPEALTIGRGIAGARAYVVDAHGELVPVGVPGELVVGGPGVAHGYLHRPGLTAARFVPDPYGEEPGARLYRTGDRVRWRVEGQLEFLGRLDDQVKVRGFRVEPGEVECALLRHPQVEQAAVVAREGRLAAYVVPAAGAAPSAATLRDFLARSLSAHLIPSAFVALSALPLTPTGKLDRRALPDPTYEQLAGEAGFVAPQTPVEVTLAAIWADVLRLERVGTHDNFFELGGDSILSIQVIARAAQAGLRLTPKQLFRHQTITELAAVVEAAPAVRAEQGAVVGPVPLTPMQRRFFAVPPPHPHHWNQALLLIPEEPLSPELLEEALDALLTHHDALRLRFTHEQGRWRQSNAAPGAAPPFAHVDLTGVPEEARRAALEQHAVQAQRSLDLTYGPLVRLLLFDLGDAQRLLLLAHHLVVDGVSWRILAEDLRTAYAQLRAGERLALPPKTTSFKQWAERLVAYAAEGHLRAEAAYWEGLPLTVPCLPRDLSGAPEANTVASTCQVRTILGSEETRALLREAPAAYHAQTEDLLLTALVQALEPWVGAPALLVDREGHGREPLFADVDLSRTVGWFTALYPVYLDLSGVREPGAALKQVKEQLRALPGRGLGYGIVRYLGPPEVAERLAALPQAELSFNYLGRLGATVAGEAPESPGPLCDPAASRPYLLELSARVVGAPERLEVTWRYSEAIHRRETVAALAAAYGEALRALVDHCLAPESGGYTPSDFPEAALSQAELDAILADVAGWEEAA